MIVRPIVCRPFVGRREELAYLHELRRAAGASKGGLVLVTGEAGLGKSRLLNELCASLAYSRYRVGRGACTEFAGRPYAPALDTLTKLEGERCELVPAASQREQIESIVARFAALAARTALVVTIEDLHWADAATLDLLSHLAPALRRMRVLVVVTLRPDALQADHPAHAGIAKMAREQAGRIDLAPLGGNDLRTFIAEALGDVPLGENVRRRIARLGEGNPFFTEELLQHAIAHEPSQRNESAAQVPPTVRAVLLERLAIFGAQERRAIAQAAVIGRTFSLELLAATLAVPTETLLPPLRRARDRLLIEELGPAAFRFRHGLVRDAIYGDFLESELRPLHRTVAETLENASDATASVERLAYHWWAAGDGERAARYNALAGDAAARLHAHEDAIGFYERALEKTDAVDAAARGTLLEKIAESRVALKWTEDAWATYGAAADLFRSAGDDEREASCRVQAALLAYVTGKREPTAALEAMLARLPAEHYAARSRVHLGIAWLAATFGFPARAQEHLRGVDPRAMAVNDVALRVHNVAAWVAMTLGRLDDFRRDYAAWVAAATAAGGVRGIVAARVNGAMCLSFFGLHDDAFAELDAALATAREARNAYGEELCRQTAVQCHFLAGDLARARAALATISPATESHLTFTSATAWGTLVGAYMDDRTLIATWFDGFETGGARTLEIECGAGFAEIMVRRGRNDDAARLLRSLLPRCDMVSGNVPTLLAIGRYGYADDRALARTYLARAAAAPAELPERAALALFDAWEHDRAGRGAEAAACAREAADGFARLRMPLLEAAARETAGDLAAALALYRRCGAAYDVARLAGGREPAAFRSPAGEAMTLSTRERDVAALAARGLSNLQIARELEISHKTVEKHLASVYGKLGIASRRELTSSA